MWKITGTIDRYPFVVLELTNITTGEEKMWAIDDVQAEEMILNKYHTKQYVGIVLDELPQTGSWTDMKEIGFF